jgi:hypothetical protein
MRAGMAAEPRRSAMACVIPECEYYCGKRAKQTFVVVVESFCANNIAQGLALDRRRKKEHGCENSESNKGRHLQKQSTEEK